MANFNLSRRQFLRNAGYLSVGAGMGMGFLSGAMKSYASTESSRASMAQAVKRVEGVTLGPPSNATYFLAIIKEKGLDKKNGIDMDTKLYADLSALYTDIGAGKALLAVTSALYNVANFYTKGVPIQITYTYATANQAVVARNPEIKATKDLKGKTVAATTGSGFYGMLFLHLQQNGIDPRKDINLISAAPPAVRTQLETGKVDAGVVWEPNLSMLIQKGFHAVGDMNADIRKSLGMKADARIWYLGAAAWKKWIDEDPERLMAVYRAFKDAEKFFNEKPDESIEVISKFTKIPKEALKLSVERKFVEFEIKPAIQEKENILKTFEGFIKTGFMDKMPDEGLFYAWPGLKG